jgi:hypothetical protein
LKNIGFKIVDAKWEAIIGGGLLRHAFCLVPKGVSSGQQGLTVKNC